VFSSRICDEIFAEMQVGKTL